ncbi:hypothetical protein ANCCEY_04899 [Ancylostoma ceylanicum]|uniref:Uncharacterized protein n=1 Tax=Ancylostoma ceylanicum TaxID=53326 RepID=A0A0D6LXQ2_9BILA|nr:hypothetical protein ANCCEY_04899 [Ancylostoma ceylanicum]
MRWENSARPSLAARHRTQMTSTHALYCCGDRTEGRHHGPCGRQVYRVQMRRCSRMVHKFEAEDEDPKVSKAKDANLREESEDWYNINDPRNKMNQRRRGAI